MAELRAAIWSDTFPHPQPTILRLFRRELTLPVFHAIPVVFLHLLANPTPSLPTHTTPSTSKCPSINNLKHAPRGSAKTRTWLQQWGAYPAHFGLTMWQSVATTGQLSFGQYLATTSYRRTDSIPSPTLHRRSHPLAKYPDYSKAAIPSGENHLPRKTLSSS